MSKKTHLVDMFVDTVKAKVPHAKIKILGKYSRAFVEDIPAKFWFRFGLPKTIPYWLEGQQLKQAEHTLYIGFATDASLRGIDYTVYEKVLPDLYDPDCQIEAAAVIVARIIEALHNIIVIYRNNGFTKSTLRI